MTVTVDRTRPARDVGHLPVPVTLGLQEGRRIVLHPLSLLGLALLCTVTGAQLDNGARAAFDIVTGAPTWFYGVLVYFAAHLVASRDHRAHSGELLGALPCPTVTRVAGLCVAAVVPTLVCAAYVAAVHAYSALAGFYVDDPSLWHLAQGPLTVLGGALLGTMVARLSPFPGTALLVMLAMVVTDAWLSEQPDGLSLLSTYVSWPVWEQGEGWHGVQPGSAAWHAGYLASLCAMAATGAFLRAARNRLRVLCLGGVFTAAAVVTGLLQLP